MQVFNVSAICYTGEVINTAINANFEQFMNELRPLVEKALAKFMLDSAEAIASSFPYKDLFPE